jgi:hypothetical protein
MKLKFNHRAPLYRRQDKPKRQFSRTAQRVKELRQLFHGRYGPMLPDDDAGHADALLMCGHLGRLKNPAKRIGNFLDVYCPWMPPESRCEMFECIQGRHRFLTADELAVELNLDYAERQHYGLRSIGSIDVDKAGRERLRRERAKLKRQEKHRTGKIKPRADWLAENSTEKTRPWIAENISRATWYRRHDKTGTKHSKANKITAVETGAVPITALAVICDAISVSHPNATQHIAAQPSSSSDFLNPSRLALAPLAQGKGSPVTAIAAPPETANQEPKQREAIVERKDGTQGRKSGTQSASQHPPSSLLGPLPSLSQQTPLAPGGKTGSEEAEDELPADLMWMRVSMAR